MKPYRKQFKKVVTAEIKRRKEYTPPPHAPFFGWLYRILNYFKLWQ